MLEMIKFVKNIKKKKKLQRNNNNNNNERKNKIKIFH